jgi:hypothetical protein
MKRFFIILAFLMALFAAYNLFRFGANDVTAYLTTGAVLSLSLGLILPRDEDVEQFERRVIARPVSQYPVPRVTAYVVRREKSEL